MLAKLFYYLIQWTWGLPQNLAGLIMLLLNRDKPHSAYKSAVKTVWEHADGLALGMFIFVWKGASERVVAHEYGHSIQSLLLGPFYLFVIGIPSILWCRVSAFGRKWRSGKKSYFAFFTERWADALGKAKDAGRETKA